MFALGLRASRALNQGAARQALKDRVRHLLRLSDDTVISVGRAACTDASCRGVQTTVLLLTPGQAACALCIDNALEHICDADILRAQAMKNTASDDFDTGRQIES